MKSRPLLCFFGHHKAASTWVMQVLEQVCAYIGLKHAHFHGPSMFGHDLAQAVREQRIDVLSYTNADLRYVKQLDDFLGFHVIRDPRDVCVSSYFSHLKTHSTEFWPELVAYRNRLSSMSFGEGMIDNMHFTAQLPIDGDNIRYFDCLAEWNYKDDAIQEVRYEDMILNPYAAFCEILAFLGLLDDRFLGVKQTAKVSVEVLASRIGVPFVWKRHLTGRRLSVALLLDTLRKMSFQRLNRGRKKGNEDRGSHMRKGVAGDWRNHFDSEIKEAFKESYADLLIQLQYEDSYDW